MNIKEKLSSLTNTDWESLTDLNRRIQSHVGTWGERKGGMEIKPNLRTMPYVEKSDLVDEFVQMMYDKDLVVNFDWKNWDEGRVWMSDNNQAKYDNLDAEFTVKLITALIRQDRFSDGSLVRWFELGVMQKIIAALVK